MKICPHCKQTKNDTEFYIRNYLKSKKLSSWCKNCICEKTVQESINKKIKAIIYLGSKCVDCSISFPSTPYVVFDFHHLDPTIKDSAWKKTRLLSWDKVLIELAKCVLLCSNCHRLRHHNEYILDDE